MQNDNWDDLRFLLAIGRSRSLLDASRKLGVNQTTVTRRLEQYEARFGSLLFERSRGGVRPTDAGAKMILHAERVELEILTAQAKLSGLDQKAEGIVRLTAVPAVVNHILVPALSGLLRTHPNLQLELVAEPRSLSLTKREADFAIRLNRPRDEAQIMAQKIGEFEYSVYGPPETADRRVPWIVYDETMAHLPHAKWMTAQCAGERAPVAVNDAETIVACLRAGLGKSVLPTALARLINGVQRIETETRPPKRDVWLLSHPHQKNLVRMQAVSKWVKEALRAATAA